MPQYKEHLFFGFASAGIMIAALHFIFHLSLINANLLTTLVITTLIFSVIPDIDHRSSIISGFLHFITILGIIALIAKLINFNFSSIVLLISLFSLELYHWCYAKDDWEHRQFPHSLTFGLFALIILFVITFSWVAVVVGATAFMSHILSDCCFYEAIEQDKKFWKLSKQILLRP